MCLLHLIQVPPFILVFPSLYLIPYTTHTPVFCPCLPPLLCFFSFLPGMHHSVLPYMRNSFSCSSFKSLAKEIPNSTSPSCLEVLISNHFSSRQTLTTFLPQRLNSLCREVSSGLIFTRHVSFLCIICSILQRTTVLKAKLYFYYYFFHFTDSLSGKSHSHAFLQHAFKIPALSSFI